MYARATNRRGNKIKKMLGKLSFLINFSFFGSSYLLSAENFLFNLETS
ncbi:hypothetical protein HMPREF9151_00774 [Hoylesella saccharolytica F0055]|uniref:Uncharacterized protein n=1 Tax=Hoylesella saccharolytica F0055 TaxID=1127699 RepID=L1NGE5_9BACT|nr:hypothetical protein HMPREF9151_00774 [Hoylesella saccharolytica F0055]